MGNSVKLGDLYDITTHQFTGQSLFDKPLPEKIIQRTENLNNRDKDIIYKDSSYETKFNVFQVGSLDTQLSILARLFPFAGSSKFFTHRVTNKKTIHRFWTFYKEIVYKFIYMSNVNIKSYVNNDTLLNTNATHIAFGIEYGMRAVMCIETKNMIMDNQTQYWGKVLEQILWNIIVETRDGVKANKTIHDDIESDINYNYYSDYTDIDEPNNLHEAIQKLHQTYYLKDENKMKAITGLSIIFRI